jgi:hypothetical protein
VPVWPARIVVVIGSALVVVSYGLHAVTAIRSFISGRAEDAPASLAPLV